VASSSVGKFYTVEKMGPVSRVADIGLGPALPAKRIAYLKRSFDSKRMFLVGEECHSTYGIKVNRQPPSLGDVCIAVNGFIPAHSPQAVGGASEERWVDRVKRDVDPFAAPPYLLALSAKRLKSSK